MNVTIIGTGKMARGIAARLLDGGHHVTLVGHTPGKAEALAEELKSRAKNGSISPAMPGTLPGEVVILAVPYSAAQSVVQQFVEMLPSKILVDISNPVNFQKMEIIVQDGSASEEISRLVPISTRVVKAFNTIFASALIDGTANCSPLDIFLAGDDAEAKAIVAQLIEGGGLRPIDAGPLVRARQLEAMGFLLMAVQNPNKLGFKGGIKIAS